MNGFWYYQDDVEIPGTLSSLELSLDIIQRYNENVTIRKFPSGVYQISLFNSSIIKIAEMKTRRIDIARKMVKAIHLHPNISENISKLDIG